MTSPIGGGAILTIILAAFVFYVVATWYDVWYTYYIYTVTPAQTAGNPGTALTPTPDLRASYQHKFVFAVMWTTFVVVTLGIVYLLTKSPLPKLSVEEHIARPLDPVPTDLPKEAGVELMRTVLPFR